MPKDGEQLKHNQNAEGHGDRCGEEPADGDEPQQGAVTGGGEVGSLASSLSNTTPAGSQESPPSSPLSPVASVDWLECGAIIDWSEVKDNEFFRLDEVMTQAQKEKKPVPFAFAGHSILVYPSGIGSGGQSRLTYRADFGPSMIAFANREAKNRGTHNLYYKIPGTACLVHGALETRRIFHEMVESLGGCITDEWIRRLDLCLDLPGVDIREAILPIIDSGCFIGSAWKHDDHRVRGIATGVTLKSGQIVLRIYDKVADVQRRDSEYLTAMCVRRWGRAIPDSATRVEVQIGGEWFRQFDEMKDFKGVMDRIPDVIEKLFGEGPRPFFRLTEKSVDRANKHQSRSGTNPLWSELRGHWQTGFGNPSRPPERLPRGMITSKRAFSLVRGVIAGDAARRGEMIQSLRDAKDQLEKMHECNFSSDADWHRVWEDKARKFRTLDETTDFPTDYGPEGEGGAACTV